MKTHRLLAAGIAVIFISAVGTASADRINVWRPVDIEQQRKFYEQNGRDFPEGLIRKRAQEARERLADLRTRLAPATPGKDYLGMRYFEGRILKLIPALDRAAPGNSDNHYPTILFEAYGPNGANVSSKPVLISTRWAGLSAADMALDTVADFSRLLSNRHELMGARFGSQRHRQTLFSALDPDRSMGLSTGPGGDMPAGLTEGALMIFGTQGALPTGFQRYQYFKTNPLDPILLLDKFDGLGMLNGLIEEYTRSKRYPGFEPDYGATAKAALQILYTLSLVTPDLTTAQYQPRARRLKLIGTAAYAVISQALGYHSSREQIRKNLNESRPFMPLTVEEIRTAVLEVLADGPVVPVPVIGARGTRGVALIGSLWWLIDKGDVDGSAALRVFERQLVPDPGEDPKVTALFEYDRELNRRTAHRIAGNARYKGDGLAVFHALARVGWGEEKEVEKLIQLFLYWATITRSGRSLEQINKSAVAILRIVARPDEYTRKDRLDYGIAAAKQLKRSIAEIRKRIERGWGSAGAVRFIEMWDN